MEIEHQPKMDDFTQLNVSNGHLDFASNGNADSSSSSAGDEISDKSSKTTTTASSASSSTGLVTQAPDLNNYDTVFPSLQSGGGEHMTVSDAWNNDNSKLLTNKRHQHTTQIFHVPVEERRYKDIASATGFGASGNETKKKCEEIATRCGVKVEMCCSKDQSLHIVISGLEEKVIESKKYIIAELQTERDRKIKVPKEQHKYLIGKGGSVLKHLQDQTCTSIQIPKSEMNSDVITITGPKDGIDAVIVEIELICDEQSKSGFERMLIPKLFHPWIRGNNNEVMNEISARTGAKINIPPAQIEKDEIAVSGEKERVEVACAEIQRIYADKLKAGITKLAIQITKSQHKLIIGKNGSSVQDIFRDFDVYVQVPRFDSNSETIYLYGEESKLGAALSQVCAKANSVMNATVEAPSWLHRYMIGEKGANISKITADYPNTHVKFSDGDRITLDGPPDEVERVKERLQNITIGLKQSIICEEIPVDHKYHSQIVGKKYENVNRMNKEYGVLVRVPDAPVAGSGLPPVNLIRVEGAPDSVARAKVELVETVTKLENERSKDIIIEQRYHANLIGKNGRHLSEVRSKFNDVQINIPSVEEKSDVVKIRGNKLDVEKCFKYLQQLVKEMQENNYQEEIHIFKEFHRLIIGKQGAFIRRIKEETATRIEIPAEDSDSDKVCIVGKRENVIKARTMLEDKVKELLKIEDDFIEIPHALHTGLIGKHGIIIKQIRRECGNVLINFPDAEDTSVSRDKITLKGPREDIDRAKEELMKQAKFKEDASFTDEIHAKLEYHRFLVGKKGAHINSLKDKYEVRIIFPPSTSSSDNNNNSGNVITLIGKEDAVKLAKAELEATIRNLDEQITDTVKVDPKWHKHFIARRGKLIYKISDDNCNVNISFPKLVPASTNNDAPLANGEHDVPMVASSDIVTIKGPKDAVEAAKKKILEVIYEFENQVTIDVNIPQKFHVSIIGKKGANSQQISDDFRVEIQFPAKSMEQRSNRPTRQNGTIKSTDPNDDESSSDMVIVESETHSAPATPSKADIIRISGLKEDCEKAKEAMLALLPVTEAVPFPHTFHRDLLANKAEILRELTDRYNVQVNVPKRGDDQADFLTLVGTSEAIEEAKARLTEHLADFELSNFRVEITDFKPEFIPQVRGRNGNEATRLQTKYDVRIDISRRGEPDKIVIKGVQANVQKCEEYLLGKIAQEEAKVAKEIQVDSRVHSRIIGGGGKTLAKIIEKFKVDIKFEGNREKESDNVVVRGDSDAVDECCDHLKNLEEEYLQDVSERSEYQHPSTIKEASEGQRTPSSKGFTVQGAPWEAPPPDTSNMDLFPTMTSAMSAPGGQKMSWGPPSRK